MALTLAQLQAERDNILDGMGKEYSRVEFGDGGVTFRPQEELDAALQRIDAEIARLQSPSQPRQFTIQTNRGI